MSSDLQQIWVYLAANPLLWLTATLAAYQGGLWVYRRSGGRPLLNPVLLAIVLLAALLMVTGSDYADYFAGAQFVHFLLGPATVALAVPLYRQFHRVRRAALPLGVATLTAALSAMGVAWLLGASRETLLSLAPKSVTTPVAMGIAEQIGGLPSLTAVLVILTGILGAAMGGLILRLVRVGDPRAQGLGLAAHGIGTAQAFQMGEVAGTFSSLAMGLNALATALMLPLLLHWLGW